MGLELLLPAAATAASVGLGCGTCCSPTVSVFLSSYIVSHAGGMKKSMLEFLTFFLGKFSAVILLCIAASVIGKQFIDDAGYVGSFDLRFVLQIAMAAVGALLTVKWILDRKRKKSNCKSCKCCDGEIKTKPNGFFPLLAAGFTYGASPCAPLILIVGYAAALPIVSAAAVGCVFAAASSLTPVLLLVILSGALSGKIAKDIPQYLDWFRLASYLLLIAFSIAAIF